MRELEVYHCPKCGHYGYYQLVKNAICPKCNLKMQVLPIYYADFMDLSCEERDKLIANVMLRSSTSMIERIMAPHKANNTREIIGKLSERIKELEAENEKLNSTISWMHDTIWDLIRKNKGLNDSSAEAAASAIPIKQESQP